MKKFYYIYNKLPIKHIFNFTFIFVCFAFLSLLSFEKNLAVNIFNNSNILNDPDSSLKKGSDLPEDSSNQDYIKWLEFNVPLEVLSQAFNYDITTFNEDIHLDWIELIAYSAAKNWGTFKSGRKSNDIDKVAIRLKNGEKMSEITKDMKLYSYYYEIYNSILGSFVGEFEVYEECPDSSPDATCTKKYGLKVFSPIAKGYYYSHYDDFGVSRSYGYKRNHLGNDLMGSVGTPIIAVEDGYVEALGWNQYGGWRIGVRSLDQKRYYYYAHLRKDHPFQSGLKEGDLVQSGDVIGYLGMTGYSKTENTNNISIPHLHFGVQIIFDESQKEGSNQIWINLYELVNFLEKNKMPVFKNTEKKEFERSLIINNVPMD